MATETTSVQLIAEAAVSQLSGGDGEEKTRKKRGPNKNKGKKRGPRKNTLPIWKGEGEDGDIAKQRTEDGRWSMPQLYDGLRYASPKLEEFKDILVFDRTMANWLQTRLDHFIREIERLKDKSPGQLEGAAIGLKHKVESEKHVEAIKSLGDLDAIDEAIAAQLALHEAERIKMLELMVENKRKRAQAAEEAAKAKQAEQQVDAKLAEQPVVETKQAEQQQPAKQNHQGKGRK